MTRHSLTARGEGPPARLPRWGPRSAGDASPLHPNAAAALGPHGLAALLLPQIFPILPPHRASHARRGPRFSVVAPCHRGGAPNAAAALGTPGRLAGLGATPGLSPRAVNPPLAAAIISTRRWTGRPDKTGLRPVFNGCSRHVICLGFEPWGAGVLFPTRLRQLAEGE